MTRLSAYVDGIGLRGPGLDGWLQARGVLASDTPYRPQPTVIPVPTALPPAERRRSGRVVRLALAVAYEATDNAAVEPSTVRSVFSSSGGDGQNCHELCVALAASDRQVSPTRFHNSVHNAPSGYWSIAAGAREPSTALCAFDASFGAGLLEAMTQLLIDETPVLLVAYDADYPQPLRAVRPIADAFGVALALAPTRSARSIAGLSIDLCEAPATRLRDPALENLRSSIPAARSLALLAALSCACPSRVVVEYLDDLGIAVQTAPCS